MTHLPQWLEERKRISDEAEKCTSAAIVVLAIHDSLKTTKALLKLVHALIDQRDAWAKSAAPYLPGSSVLLKANDQQLEAIINEKEGA